MSKAKTNIYEIQKIDLPSSWTRIQIGNVCSTTSGGTPSRKIKKYYKGVIPWVKSGELNDGLISDIEEYITDEAIANSSAKVFSSGTLLIALYGATVGKLGILAKDAATNQAVCAIFPPEDINKKYLFWHLRYIRSDLIASAIGGAQPNISQGIIKNTFIPIAPINEQKRIVAEIEKQFSRLDEAVDNLKRVKANLKRYKTSILKTAMTGKLTEDWREKNPNIESAEKLIKRISKKRQEESKKRKKKSKKQKEISYSHHPKIISWVNVQLDQLIYIAGRIGWRGLKADEYTDEGPLFLSVHALNYGEEVRYDQANHISEERYVESPEIMLYENDILLCKDGAGIGKIGIVKNLPGKATVNSSLLVIRAQEAFIPKFLFYFLSGPDLQGIVKARITGSATPHLFQRDIKQFVLSVPPLAEQKEIVNRIESHLSVIEGVSYQVDIELKRADRLQQSILKKAFSGKLVPQDPNDEPATVLLRKIRAEKETSKREPKKEKKGAKVIKMAKQKKEIVKLTDVLAKFDKPISPETLFQETGYTIEKIDEFYESLKYEVDHTNNKIQIV